MRISERSRLSLSGGLAALLASVLLGFSVGGAAPDPVAPTPDENEDLRREVLAHRIAEAEGKARLHEGLARARAMRTPNQNEFDILHYDLDLDLDPSTNTLSGTVTTTAEIVGTSVTTMDLNLRNNMAVSAANNLAMDASLV